MNKLTLKRDILFYFVSSACLFTYVKKFIDIANNTILSFSPKPLRAPLSVCMDAEKKVIW